MGQYQYIPDENTIFIVSTYYDIHIPVESTNTHKEKLSFKQHLPTSDELSCREEQLTMTLR